MHNDGSPRRRPTRRRVAGIGAMALAASILAPIAAPSAAGAATFASGAKTRDAVCTYSVDGLVRQHQVTLLGPLTATFAAPSETFTLSGVQVLTAFPPELLAAAYSAGLLQLGLNTIPAQAWASVTGTNTIQGTQVLTAASIVATTTISVDGSGAVSATPLTLQNSVLGDSSWTQNGATGGGGSPSSVAFSLGAPGSLGALTVGGNSVTPSGNVYISAELSEARLNLDCQPGQADGEGGVLNPSTDCINSLASYDQREVERYTVELSGAASSRGASGTVNLTGTELEMVVPGDLILSAYRRAAGYAGFQGYFLPGTTEHSADVWVAVEGVGSAEGVQVVHGTATYTTVITDPDADLVSPFPARQNGNESAEPVQLQVQLADSAWTATGDEPMAFRQAGPVSIPDGTISVAGAPSGTVYPVFPFGSVFIRTATEHYGVNIDCVAGDIAITNTAIARSIAGRFQIINQAGTIVKGEDRTGRYTITPTVATAFASEGLFHPVGPHRLADTRDGSGTAKATLKPGQVLTLSAAGVPGVPATSVGALSLNVTAANTTADGYLTVFPCSTTAPNASNVNFVAGQAGEPNAVITGVNPAGEFCITSFAESDVIVDVTGWVSAGSGFVAQVPKRISDSRDGTGTQATPLAPGQQLVVDVVGNVPGGDAYGAALNVTAANTTADGYLTVYPCGSAAPGTSNVNYVSGQAGQPNAVVTGLSTDGKVCITSFATSDVIVDLAGVFVQPNSFTGITPQRVADTRDGTGVAKATLKPGTPLTIALTGLPSTTAAVALNVTAANTTADGYLTVYPCGGAVPNASNVNFVAGQAGAPNAVLTGVSASGEVCVSTFAETDVIVDLTGWF